MKWQQSCEGMLHFVLSHPLTSKHFSKKQKKAYLQEGWSILPSKHIPYIDTNTIDPWTLTHVQSY
jgi:hypothetical protein